MRMAAAFVQAHAWWVMAVLLVVVVLALSAAADWLSGWIAQRVECVEREEEARLRRQRVSRELADDIARRRRELGMDSRQVRG